MKSQTQAYKRLIISFKILCSYILRLSIYLSSYAHLMDNASDGRINDYAKQVAFHFRIPC